jgi:hypothetical protein
MKLTRSTILTGLAILILASAIPSAIQEALESGRIYLFSWDFLADLPKRLTGPGRLRFILQPTVAMILGIRGGRVDARAGRPPYLFGLFFHAEHRGEYLRTGLTAIRDIVAIGIILDAVAQFLIFRQVHPFAALVVGPVLIGGPYAIARGLSNRWARQPGGVKQASDEARDAKRNVGPMSN